MNSLDGGSRRTSDYGKKGKISRKGASNGDENDTPELREARIQLYMSRAEKPGINIFTGTAYTPDELVEMDVEDMGDE